jgi:hypothetical protein
MRILVRCLAVAAVVAVTGGCTAATSSDPAGTPATNAVVRLPENVDQDGVVLYKRFTQRLVAYDRKTFRVTQESNAPNYIQYSFPVLSDFFTAGNSIGDDFSVLRVRGNSVETVLRMPPNTGIFPLATDGRRRIYTMSRYTNGTEDSRVVVAIDDAGKIQEYPSATGLVDSGAIIGSVLHFTTFDEKTEKYTLSTMDLDHADAKPRLVSHGLAEGPLFVHDGQLFQSAARKLVSGKKTFECTEYCYFYDEFGVLLRVYLSREANLSLDVVDLASQRVLASYADLVDFTVKDGKMVVYRNGGIDRTDLATGKSE